MNDEEPVRLSQDINDDLLMAVACGDSSQVRRILSRDADVWLQGRECQSDDPEKNAALAALCTPLGPDCLEEFEWFYGDVCSWRFGRWLAIHWAVAQKNEWALDFLLDRGAKLPKLNGVPACPLLEPELKSSEHSLSTAQRTGLGIAAQMGDISWLNTVLLRAQQAGYSLDFLIQKDCKNKIPALSLALFEWADQCRQGASEDKQAALKACACFLRDQGFTVPQFGAASSKLCVMLALMEPNHPGNKAVGKVAKIAAKMSGVPGPYYAAGLALDLRWMKALVCCGLKPSKTDCFGLGVSQALFNDLNEASPRGDTGYGWKSHKKTRQDLMQYAQVSWVQCNVSPTSGALKGLEQEYMNFWNRDPKSREKMWASWQQKRDLVQVCPHEVTPPRRASRL
jgi:hypothetical protein